jgi:hypothetical protein
MIFGTSFILKNLQLKYLKDKKNSISSSILQCPWLNDGPK